MNVTIIANGLFPERADVLECIGRASWTVCCDGGWHKYQQWARRQPAAATRRVSVVGDGDSLGPCWQEQAAAAEHVHIAEQDDNDLTKAVRHVMQTEGEKVEQIDILGATGLREDHTLGNISLLAYYATIYPSVRFRMLSDYGIMLPMQGHARFESHAGQQISIFSLSPQTPVSVEGLRYPICNRRIEWWWEATLNEALGDHFDVSGGLLIIYLKHPTPRP